MIHLSDFDSPENAASFAVTDVAPAVRYSGPQPANAGNPNVPSWKGRFVGIADVAIHIAKNRDALTNDFFVPANVPFEFVLNFGEGLSYIADNTGGTLYIAKVT